jgi:YidC/Oxa1 family membrane protein insertase
MDRTSRIGLFVCLVLLVGVEFTIEKLYPTPPPKPRSAVTASTPPSAVAPATVAPVMAAVVNPTMPPTPSVPVVEKLTVIENDAMKVTFTSVGAAIKEVELKQHRADNGGHVVLNEQSHSNVLALSGWPGADTANFQFQAVPDGVVYSCDLPDGVKWVRTYTFGKYQETQTGMSGYLRVLFHKIARHLGQPETQRLVYTLDVSDTLTNTGASDVTLPAYSLSVGRAAPLRVAGHYQEISNMYLGSGWLAGKFHLTTVSDFTPGSIPIIGIKTRDGKDQFSSQIIDPSPLRWIGVENQFFTVLLTPSAERSIPNGDFRCFNPRDPDGNLIVKRDPENNILPGYEPDIEASATFSAISVPAGKVVTLNYGLYAGPKDFNRLDALGADQGALMNYGWFELLIVPMLTVLHFWFLIFHNYGVAIILLTLIIKAITWPLQSIANHSGKRMQALAPKLKELQAKHKGHPEKLQTETFALYKEYGVNPFGGCLPALVQMPVFFSLYFMLQNAVELRGQSFLWVHDLTQPDTVASWSLPLVIPFLNTSHLAIHPLPIMVTALTMVMMRMTPQIGDPQQAKIAQFMPLVFLLIFYNFAAALSLYYVINNCVSIVQIYRNLRKPLPELKRVPRKKKE